MSSVSNAIVLSSCLFGSVYILATSINNMNKLYLHNHSYMQCRNQTPYYIIGMNGLLYVLSGSILTYTFYKTMSEKYAK